MKPASTPSRGPDRGRRRLWGSATTAAIALCLGETAAAQVQPLDAPAPAQVTRLNPAGRPIRLTAPLTLDDVYLGDIELWVSADDVISIPTGRLLELLEPLVDRTTSDALRTSLTGQSALAPGKLVGLDMELVYRPELLSLEVRVPAALRAARSLSVGGVSRAPAGEFERPASLSSYLNVRAAVDHVNRGPDSGLQAPVVLLEGAMRARGVVLESDAVWRPSGAGPDVQRLGSRLVYDDIDSIVRWTAGDLQPAPRGFQASPPLAGLSITRSYGELRPFETVRPTGRESFVLQRPSMVEIHVNGQLIRRIQLEPGPYDLGDFPAAQGANDVRIVIVDDAGRREVLRFNLFFDQSQLAPGLSEFGFWAGVKAPMGSAGPVYSDAWGLTAFYRRGLTEHLTVGANVQAESGAWLLGAEAVWSSPLGVLAGHLAVSDQESGRGFAGVASFQRETAGADGHGGLLSLTAEAWSVDFAVPGGRPGDHPLRRRFAAGYGHSFGNAFYAGADLQYAVPADPGPDPFSIRANLGWRLGRRLDLTAEAVRQFNAPTVGDETAVRVALTVRLGPRSSVRAVHDGVFDVSRIAYQTSAGEGVGAYNGEIELQRSAAAFGINGAAYYIANRAEVGVTQYNSFDRDSGSSTDGRTTLRLATALAFADGTFAVGRPIQDGFAIVRAHPSLLGAQVQVDPTSGGYTAATGWLGPALKPNLTAWSERSVAISAPDAPMDLDLGPGAYRVLPPYRAGYLLQAGSDYHVTVTGRLVDEAGKPISLLAGEAFEIDHPQRRLTVFTNTAGRFSLSGLRPGQWLVEMRTEQTTVYRLDIPVGADVLESGEIRPLEMETP
ncbi:fimbrial biogenesis outer membrane usher protein [Brevundimonas sp.]|uniref:fimbrial biogenesis outer membrane usher protein n=1 Tax=Brevundimonas sp. TaxID=1871086 RepID=UPI002D556C8D|nr:fimbrial biogenesis outer membrane usher protein [Brevundimonas sp.]HYD26483.1 fimbrial biogenesis outer membrane usher protein [Brevundimonas sp.]